MIYGVRREMTLHRPILKYFRYEHLPVHLQNISRPFEELARLIANTPDMDIGESEVALRKLLEAKDAAVRAALR